MREGEMHNVPPPWNLPTVIVLELLLTHVPTLIQEKLN